MRNTLVPPQPDQERILSLRSWPGNYILDNGTKRGLNIMRQAGDLSKIVERLPGGLVAASFGNTGVAVYPGQSAEDVLKVALVIKRELDKDFYGHHIDNYLARNIAREVLLCLKKLD